MSITIALAIAPVFILLHAIYVADRYEKEPIRNLISYLVVGGLVVIPACIVEVWADTLKPSFFAIDIFVRIALVEEGAKFIGLWYRARKDPELNEPFDWIVYSVSIALGFAMIENVTYALGYGLSTTVIRAFTAVPGHALNGTFMGDRLARAARSKGGAVTRERFWAIAEPTLWHTMYDIVATKAGIGIVMGLVLLQYAVASSRVRGQQRLARPGQRTPPILLPHKIALPAARAKTRG